MLSGTAIILSLHGSLGYRDLVGLVDLKALFILSNEHGGLVDARVEYFLILQSYAFFSPIADNII